MELKTRKFFIRFYWHMLRRNSQNRVFILFIKRKTLRRQNFRTLGVFSKLRRFDDPQSIDSRIIRELKKKVLKRKTKS